MTLRVRNITDLIALNTAHDVRHLRGCHGCGDLGDDRRMICFPASVIKDRFWHGRCFIKKYGMKTFLTLPMVETNKLPVGDIGVRAMRKLMERHE